ncbi:MAG: hypothetical protein P1U85_10705 [Verrucomicrobiales bacterium]|nr:hypothetical protein [Verrucomicrobiales bacterium]
MIRWPALVKEPGHIAHGAVHFIDFFPTFLHLAGEPTRGLDLAGESILPLLRGEAWRRERPLFFQMADNRAIRTADWSLVEVDGAGWELYASATDPLETRNLAETESEVVAELSGQWMAWWRKESGSDRYRPVTTVGHPAYTPQGDRGTGALYLPPSMPAALAHRYPLP